MIGKLFLLSLLVAAGSVGILWYNPHLKEQVMPVLLSLFNPKLGKCQSPTETIFTPDQLKQHDGTQSDQILLGFLGKVYDVSRGKKHYGPGGSYAFFSGRDATRSFVTGNFEPDELEKDDVTDLEQETLSGVKTWSEFYDKDYPYVGKVIGTYYDLDGCERDSLNQIRSVYKQLEVKAAAKKEEEKEYPPCNNEWSQDKEETRFWCSRLSGGVTRDWVGKPRQLYMPESQTTRCACIRMDDERDPTSGQEPSIVYDEGDPRLKEYPGCHPKSFECSVKDK